jgi:hypothetical protein
LLAFIDNTGDRCILNRKTRVFQVYTVEMFARLTITGQDILEFFNVNTCDDFKIMYSSIAGIHDINI